MKASPRSIVGIDFSGASDAGKKIWITTGRIEDARLVFENCFPASNLPGSSKQRHTCLQKLREFIRGQGNSICGADFPFGLPSVLVAQENWTDFILRFPSEYSSPEYFRKKCFSKARNRELKRVTDEETKTPFSPYNLRVYKQTYYGIRDFLAPLVNDGLVCVLPMQQPLSNRIWMIEICPASTLKQLALYDGQYKGSSDMCYLRRRQIIELLQRKSTFVIPDLLKETAVRDIGGDALDSMIAALATFWAFSRSLSPGSFENAQLTIEGHVFT